MIIIEGLIGVGKSTALKNLEKKYPGRFAFYYEPVESNPYLSLFYQDMKRWGLTMQFFLMVERFKMHLEAIEKEWYEKKESVFDRSIYGDSVFAEVLHDDGIISDLDFHTYMCHRKCMEKQLLLPQQVFFLDVPPDVALGRIQKRGRECEQGIPLDYLKKLDVGYRKVMDEMSKKTNVHYLDWKEYGEIEI